ATTEVLLLTQVQLAEIRSAHGTVEAATDPERATELRVHAHFEGRRVTRDTVVGITSADVQVELLQETEVGYHRNEQLRVAVLRGNLLTLQRAERVQTDGLVEEGVGRLQVVRGELA